MKYWITKYALTEGIQVIDIPMKPGSDGYLSYIQSSPLVHHFYNVKQWHPSFECAVIRAEEMRKSKVVSLHKQIAKLEKMTFEKKTAQPRPEFASNEPNRGDAQS